MYQKIHIIAVTTKTPPTTTPTTRGTTKRPEGCTDRFDPQRGFVNAKLSVPDDQFYIIDEIYKWEDCQTQCTFEPLCRSITWNFRQRA